MKMSDALRGAAETAAVETAHVSVSAARSRARRARMLRGSANGIVGVGAAALVVAGVMGVVANQGGLVAADPEIGAGNGDFSAPNVSAPNAGAAGDMPLAPAVDAAVNACGGAFDASAFVVDPATATISVDGIDSADLDITLSTTAASEGEFTTGQPTLYVLWDGIIVGTPAHTDEAWVWESVPGEVTELPQTVPLMNCWDGAPLPAGDYTVVSAQDLATAIDVPPVSEDLQPTVSPDASDANVAPARTTIVSEPSAFTVPGEPAKDPFAQYLRVDDPDPVLPAPAGPSDVLTVDQARAAYKAGLTDARWDMAAGTQRVVMTSASNDLKGTLWQKSYFGCPMDGANSAFPAQSAEVDWLHVEGQLPSAVHLSYGWVVDGNPVVSYSVTNTTDSSLPGFYGGYAPRLVLVKDGKVVAEAYTVDPQQNVGGIAYAAAGAAASSPKVAPSDSMVWAPDASGYLSPGASKGGDFLWRDVNGCWTANGQVNVAPGSYTVLSAQDLYVGGQYPVYMEGADDGATADAIEGSGGGTDSAVAPIDPPAPDQAPDFASFQVWTSLGTVTISN